MVVRESFGMSLTSTLRLNTSGAPQFIDITEEVRECVERSGIQHGLVVVFSKHTTAAIIIQENEPLLLDDLARFLEDTAPRHAQYRHNNFALRNGQMAADEAPNGHAHCQHLFLSPSQTIPVVAGEMPLGQWQRIFLAELDRARPREVAVHVIGA